MFALSHLLANCQAPASFSLVQKHATLNCPNLSLGPIVLWNPEMCMHNTFCYFLLWTCLMSVWLLNHPEEFRRVERKLFSLLFMVLFLFLIFLLNKFLEHLSGCIFQLLLAFLLSFPALYYFRIILWLNLLSIRYLLPWPDSTTVIGYGTFSILLWEKNWSFFLNKICEIIMVQMFIFPNALAQVGRWGHRQGRTPHSIGSFCCTTPNNHLIGFSRAFPVSHQPLPIMEYPWISFHPL